MEQSQGRRTRKRQEKNSSALEKTIEDAVHLDKDIQAANNSDDEDGSDSDDSNDDDDDKVYTLVSKGIYMLYLREREADADFYSQVKMIVGIYLPLMRHPFLRRLSHHMSAIQHCQE